jgi:ADP-heptose:LPS heptosyltransferase
VDELIIKKEDVILNLDFDFYIHLMSLPRVFNTKEDSIPHNIPYLKSNRELVKKFKNQMNAENFKVGIVWAGNPNQENDKNRSTTFKRFKILSEIPNVVLFSLQKEEASNQLNDNKIINMEKDMKDFNDTAAIIENLDLIISIDTSIAHLAGAMGKPVWVLLSYTPDWRWLLNKKDNSWYPTMKLFRQKKAGDWDSLFKEVADELRNLANNLN